MESRLRSWGLSVEKTQTLAGGRGTEAGGGLLDTTGDCVQEWGRSGLWVGPQEGCG